MSQLIFDEKSMLDGNLFKFEQRLQSHMNKYVANGALLTIYFSQDEDSTTVDRGTQDIDELFGKHSPLRYHEIDDFPIYGFGQANPENTDELQIEDFNVEGDAIILPSTIVPRQMDFFIIKHLKMTAIFEITNVNNDSMKANGYYQIRYRLHSTSAESVAKIRSQVTEKFHIDLNEIGGNLDPVIREDDFVLRGKIKKMVNKMISAYKAMFYNERHNCFLWRDPNTGYDWFDMCGNEFIAKYAIMNHENANQVIVLQQKITDSQLPIYYNNSIYNWLEMDAPARMLQKFAFTTVYAEGYPYSSFAMWDEGDTQVMIPLAPNQVGINSAVPQYSFFNDTQMNAFLNKDSIIQNEYDKFIHAFIHRTDLTIQDVSLTIGDALINSVNSRDTFLYTPLIIYIIRKILGMN